jgi:hypothetical protein
LRTLVVLLGIAVLASCTRQGAFLEPIENIEVKVYGSNDPGASYCDAFRPSPRDMEKIFRRVIVVTMRQIHDNFDVGPCFANGKASFGHSEVT